MTSAVTRSTPGEPPRNRHPPGASAGRSGHHDSGRLPWLSTGRDGHRNRARRSPGGDVPLIDSSQPPHSTAVMLAGLPSGYRDSRCGKQAPMSVSCQLSLDGPPCPSPRLVPPIDSLYVVRYLYCRSYRGPIGKPGS
jgi:hypothetical protein